MVLLYVSVVALYAINDRAAALTGCADTPPDDGMLYSLTPQSVNAATDRISANIEIQDFGPLADANTGLSTRDLTLVVTANDGRRTFALGAGEIPSPIPLQLITDGFIEQWPFDSHSVVVSFLTLRDDDGTLSAVPTYICGSAHVPGWTFTSTEVEGRGDLVIDGRSVDALQITATRSVPIIAFGVVLIALMIVMPILVLTVATLIYTGRRKVEPSLMSWTAAMLFATIPLRTFLPGSPPIGSWIDFVIVLWVIFALVSGLAIYVAAWVRWSPKLVAGESGVPVEEGVDLVVVDPGEGAPRQR